MDKTAKQVISKKRVADHGEVFTARREVDAMLDLVKQETERIDSRFLEPACGTGNFLIAILERKLAVIERKLIQLEKRLKKGEKRPGWKIPFYEPDSLLALSSIYGIDILQDSIDAAKSRLLAYFVENYQRIVGKEIPLAVVSAAEFILDKNILLGDAINTREKVTLPGVPGLDQIVFTEWSRIDNDFKRREFRFDTMHLDGAVAENSSDAVCDDLFAAETPATHKVLTNDSGKDIMKPIPVREYPLTHYSRLANGEHYAN
jgi:SAM-dependent methyltransferase